MAIKSPIQLGPLTITAEDTFLTTKMRAGEILAIVRGDLTGTTVTAQMQDTDNSTFVDIENGSFTAAATKRLVIPANVVVQIGVKTGDKGAGDPIVSLRQD